jgi:hypothetical protein
MMNKTGNNLTEEFARIATMVKRIEVYDGNIPRIERDILLEQLRQFYDTVLDYCSEEELMDVKPKEPQEKTPEPLKADLTDKLYGNVFAPPEENREPEATAEPVLEKKEESYSDLFEENSNKGLVDMEFQPSEPEEKPLEEEETPITEELPEPEEVPQEEPKTEPMATTIEDDLQTVPQESPLPDEVEEAPAPEPVAEPEPEQKPTQEPSLFDYLSQSTEASHQQTVVTVGDKLEQRANVAQQAMGHKVDDLRTVININDKFSFVGSLFGNNMRAYTEFILELNAATTRQEAETCVSRVAQQYHWNMDSLEVKNFYKILERKF